MVSTMVSFGGAKGFSEVKAVLAAQIPGPLIFRGPEVELSHSRCGNENLPSTGVFYKEMMGL